MNEKNNICTYITKNKLEVIKKVKVKATIIFF